MELQELGLAAIPAITVICYLVGMICKASALDNQWIPCVMGVLGAVLGVAAMLVMESFPAQDPIGALAVGIVSGLAATGVHEAVSQLKKGA